jgi:hypothetical protein
MSNSAYEKNLVDVFNSIEWQKLLLAR